MLLSVNSLAKITNYSLNLEQMWRLWAKALGEKAHKKDHVADQVALVRTVIFLTYLVTNVFIIAGVIRHWNDVQPETPTIRSHNTLV